MTLPDVPEWRTRMHLQTEKPSGNNCTQRAGISVPREFTAKAQSQRQREQTRRSPKRRKASRKMNLVETRNKSKHHAGQWPSKSKARPKREGKWDESKCKNESKQMEKWEKASRPRPAKRQAKSKTCEVQRRRLPKDASVNNDHQQSTEVHKSTEPRRESTTNMSLSRRRSNELPKGGWPCQKCALLISRKPTGRRSTETDWEFDREVYWEVDQSSPTDKPKPTGMKSTEKSTGKVQQDESMPLPAARYTLQSMRKHCTELRQR